MIENSNFISNPNLVFSERSDSLEISRLKKKDMSHLSRRDLSRMEDTSELNSGGEQSKNLAADNLQSQFAKISMLTVVKRQYDGDDPD